MKTCEDHGSDVIVVFEGNGFASCPVCAAETNLNDRIQILEGDLESEHSHGGDLEGQIETLEDEISKLKQSQDNK